MTPWFTDRRITRRRLLQQTSAWGLSEALANRAIGRASVLAGGILGAGNSALAAAPDDRKFVLVILRGAMDGLAAVAPYGDPAYRAARGRLAFDPPGSGDAALLPLVDGFGLHPRLSFLHELWQER